MSSIETKRLQLLLSEQTECAADGVRLLAALKASLQIRSESEVYHGLSAFERAAAEMQHLEAEREKAFRACLQAALLPAHASFDELMSALERSGSREAAARLTDLRRRLKEGVIRLQTSVWMVDGYLQATKGFLEGLVSAEMEQRGALTYGKTGAETFSGNRTSFLLNIQV